MLTESESYEERKGIVDVRISSSPFSPETPLHHGRGVPRSAVEALQISGGILLLALLRTLRLSTLYSCALRGDCSILLLSSIPDCTVHRSSVLSYLNPLLLRRR
jgi:hypothetical protein